MNFKRAPKGGLVIQLDASERDILQEALKLYPLVPATHHRLSQTTEAGADENQRLLEESLAEQRAENRRQLDAVILAPERWRKVGNGFHLRLSAPDVEWLLQVFNDIRVGSWLQLGQPDEDKPPELSAENFRYVMAMEICGLLESALLAALGEAESPDWRPET